MCHGDVSVVLRRWDTAYDPPRSAAEFGSFHRCRDFDRIVAWNKENSLDYSLEFSESQEMSMRR